MAAASPALPGLLLCLAATILLILVCVSPPTWDKISFLNVNSAERTIHFGVFGFTGSKVGFGYKFNASSLGLSNDGPNTIILSNLTKVLILHPIAAGLIGLSVLFGICGAYHRAGTVLMALFSAFATVCTLVAFVIDMIVFGIARNRFRDHGIHAQYGNAIWMTLGALIALGLGFCASSCGAFGRYRRRKVGY